MPTFTPKQAAELTGIPASTLRRYRAEWREFLSHPNRKRSYTQEDLDTLRVIRDQIKKGRPREDIIQLLQTTPTDTLIIDIEQEQQFEPEPEPPPPQETGIQAYDLFQNMIDKLTDEHQTALHAKDDHISDLQKEIAWLRLPWWRRLFSTPPE